MRRVIVLGGFGFFGAAAIQRLRADGLSPLLGSRRPSADVQVDVEDAESLRGALRPGDVVIDAVGPYQERRTTLVEAAIEIGFDLVDIADSVAYVRGVHALRERIETAGIRVYTACSGFSAMTAAMVRRSGITAPIRVTGFLAPATRYSAVAGTAASLFCSVGRPIEVFDGGRLVTRVGWRTARSFPMPAPIGRITGYLFECADSITIPPLWPSLRTVDCYVDANVLGLNFLFSVAARSPALRDFLDKHQRLGLPLTRLLGSTAGGLGYEIEGSHGEIVRLTLTSRNHGYLTAIAPTVMVARALAEQRVPARGLITPKHHVDPEELLEYLEGLGVTLQTDETHALRNQHRSSSPAAWPSRP